MRTSRFALILFVLSLVVVPASPAEAAGPYFRGPMVAHVSPTTATIWAYSRYRTGLRVYFRQDGADKSTARHVDMNDPGAGPRRAQVLLRGLEPSTRYVYRVLLNRQTQPGWDGSFTTPPVAGQASRFTIALASCMKDDHDFQDAWHVLLAQKPDLQLLLGDNAYVDSKRRGNHWSKHMDMRRVGQFQNVLRQVPTYAIWDDHDFAGDNSAGAGLKERVELLQVFQELWGNPAAGIPGVPGAFFKLTRGDVDFFVLDVRYHRSRLGARNDARKRMLGDGQFQWLARGLRQSKARFKVICSGSTIAVDGKDCWTQYEFALQRVYDLIRDARIDGVFWVSGDLHRSQIEVQPKAKTGFYDLVEVVSSGIAVKGAHSFATLSFDTTVADPTAHIRIIHGDGSIPQERVLRASELRAAGTAPR